VWQFLLGSIFARRIRDSERISSALCSDNLLQAKIKKFTTKEPKMGDLIIFEFASDSDNEIDHIGIFGEWIVKNHSFTAIEGNTSSSDKGSQSNGGGVFKKRREIKDVLAFVNLIDNIK